MIHTVIFTRRAPRHFPSQRRHWLVLAVLLPCLCISAPSCLAQEREDEIVANLASGRVIVHVTKEGIAFATIEKPLEPSSIPPRIVSINSLHMGVMLGAAEWVFPSQGSNVIRVEKHLSSGGGSGGATRQSPGEAEMDLDRIGESFLEALRPLVEQLHSKVELGPEDPLFELVVIGYGPEHYGPEVWLFEYRIEQEELRGNYLRTRILRPRTTQLYPPEKHEPKRLIEVRYPPDLKGPDLQVMIQRNDPEIARLVSSEPRFAKVTEKIDAGQANVAKFLDALDFLRAAVGTTAGKARFTVGKFEEERGFAWLVAPEEPVERAEEDKNRPAEAPTLVRKPKP